MRAEIEINGLILLLSRGYLEIGEKGDGAFHADLAGFLHF
jgi:hypothetical protein